MMKLKKFLLYWRVHAVKRELFCLKKFRKTIQKIKKKNEQQKKNIKI